MSSIPADSPRAPGTAAMLDRWRGSSDRPVVFLHGFDGEPDAYDLDLLLARLGSTSLVRANGPVRTSHGLAWWEADNGEDPAPDAWSRALDTALNHLPETGQPVVLVGFSQGAAAAVGLALRPATSAHAPVAAVVAVAGFLAAPVAALPDAPPVLFVHPTDDSVVDVFLAERATRVLRQHGVDVTLHEIDGDHVWSNAVVEPAVAFLLNR